MGEIGDRVQYWAWVVINIGLLHIPAWLGQGVLFHICQGANVKFGLFTRPVVGVHGMVTLLNLIVLCIHSSDDSNRLLVE